jgi:ABC-type branched-subunit amino acid transport system ATPase component
MIELQALTKRYGDFTAVDAVTLAVRPGEIFGFLGPNGAGKTTTLRMISGILLPTAGTVRIAGVDVVRDPIKAKSRLGFIPDRPFIYEKLTGGEFLRFVAGLYGQAGPDTEHRARELLTLFDLDEWRDELVESYSHGMRQKLIISSAFVHRPDVIVGDMDSISEAALRSGAEIVLHAYRDGQAPGRERLEQLRLPYKVVEATGTSEDVAYLLAHDKGADLIVAVGSHGNLREFLDKGRGGMASSFLVRLRVGEILVDAKGVSRMYRGRIRGRDMALLVGAALFSMAAVIAVSEPLQLFFRQLLEMGRQLLFRISQLF